MRQEIIDKLKLVATDILIGTSSGPIQVFQFEEFILVAMCDDEGHSLVNKLTFWTRDSYTIISEKFCLMASKEGIYETVERCLNVILKRREDMTSEEYYQNAKRLVLENLRQLNFHGPIDVKELAKEYTDLVNEYVAIEDYEAARAVKEGLKEFLESYGLSVGNAKLKL
jgi:hypothetical protein